MFKTGCIDKIYSVSAVLGGPSCNAKCPNCAGVAIRKDAKLVKEYNRAPRNIVSASRLALNYGAWTLSLTSSGEPTLYPGAISDTLQTLKREGVHWPFINLFSNGINIGNGTISREQLIEWKSLGLTSVVLSIHSVDFEHNRQAYGNPEGMRPTLEVLKIIRDAGLCAKIVLLLSRNNVGTLKEYKRSLDALKEWGVGLVTSWEIRRNDGSRVNQTLPWWEMLKIKSWLRFKNELVMGHIWGGLVVNYRDMNVRLTDYVSKHKPSNDFLRQLVLLPNGKVSYSWFQKGMFCLD